MSLDWMTKRVYLDTNHWIKLAQIANGKENDPEYKKIFIAIKKLTKSDKIQVLFSAFTLNEIWKHSDKEKQDKLIDLIIDISKGYVLKPYIFFKNKEIENAASFVLEKKYIHDIHSEILGKGLADIYDLSFEKMNKKNPNKWNLLKNNPYGLSEDFFKKDFQRFNEDPEIIKKTLKNKERKELGISKNFLGDLKEDRFKNSEMSKDLFSKYLQARDLIDSVVPHLLVFLLSKKITFDQIFSPNNKEKIFLFKKHLNSFNVFSILCLERDFSAEKQIISNDAYDMAHLSGAIPYCDVVVTEKMFAHISIKKKLDQMYDCVILDDLRSLSKIEPIKSKIQKLEII